ncbi:calcium channel protein, partial [Rhizopus stolonifer]
MSHLFRDYRFGSEIDSSEGRSVASSLIAPNSDRPSIQDNAYYEPLTSSLLAKKNQLDSREHKEDPSKKTKTRSISRKVPKNFVDSNDSERGTQYHTSNSSQSVNTSHASYSQNTFEHNSQSNTDRARRFSGLIRLSAAHIALKRSDKEEQSQHALYNIFRALSTIASRVMNCRVSEPMDTRMSVDEFISLSEYLKTMKPFSISDEQQQLGQNQPIPETIHSDSLEINQYTTSEFSKKRRKFGSLGYMFSFAPSRHITSKYSDTEDEEESNDTDNLLSPPSASDHDATDFRSSSNIFYFMCHAFQFVKNYVQPVKDNYIQIQFQGWSLFLFSPTSQIRLMLWKIIGSKQFEVFVFVLLLCQWAILSLVPIRFSAKEPFFSYPVDYLLFIINSVFTFELLSKIVVYGFCLNKHSLKKPTLSSIFGRVVNVLGMSLAERESTIKYRRLSIQSQDSDKSDTTSIHYLRQRLPAFAANPQSRSTSFSSASNISHRQNRIQDDGSDCLTNGSSQLIESFKRRPRNGNGRKQEDINTNLAAAKYQILASLKPTLDNDSSTVQTLEVTHKVFLSSIANIIDLISIGSYWVDVAMLLCFHQLPWSVFQACACIRIFRLLVLTEGTSVIMESIFSSLDMLKNVMGFFVFFWILFSLAALGLFMNAFSRQCAVLPLTQNQTIQYVEPRISCSGYILNESQERTGVFDLESKTQFAYMGADGHYCHFGQICVQDSINQPEHGYMSFDNIFYAMLNMFTIISTENWTDLLYITQNSISTIGAAAFYSVCIYLMTFILVPMFIAVITTSFSRSRGDMRQSAFSSREKASKKAFLSSKKSRKEPNQEWVYDESADLNNRAAHTILKRMSRLKNLTYTMIYHARFKYFWSIMVLINMIAMSFFQSSFSIEHKQLLDLSNRIFNIMFVLEILMRVYGSLGWKQFWYRKFTNKTDFVLMLGTILGEFSFIKSSKYHHLFVLFAILRSYRIAYLFPGVLQLISDVVGEGQGIINLTFFTFLVLFLLSPLSVQLFGGDFTFVDENEPSMRFDNFYQAFLSVFQIMTGENWTDILYDAMYSQEYASITYAAVFVTFLYFAVH